MFAMGFEMHPPLGSPAGQRGAASGESARQHAPRRPRLGRSETATILFADICGSVPLYKAAGDHHALALVSERIDTAALIAREHGGDIVRSKGDDLLCTFTDAEEALRAARRMTQVQRDSAARVRVALHHGRFIRARGDIFGDAVNLAARVLGLGRADEVLATAEYYAQLAPTERTALRKLGDHTLKGVDGSVMIFAALPVADADKAQAQRTVSTLTRTFDPTPGRTAAAATLVVECGATRARCADGETLRIGRAPTCDILVPLSWVSREHASVTIRDGKLTLTDHSSTGTHVRLADGHTFVVRRETVLLAGPGVIIPGGEQEESAGFEVSFRVERS